MNPFTDYFIDLIRNKYADFDGRARRSEYWYYTLFYYVGIFAIVFFSSILESFAGSKDLAVKIIFAYLIALMIPSLAVKVRRLHDTSNSGWMLLIKIIPLVGSIIILVFMCSESTPEVNRWGPNPKNLNLGNDVVDHLLEDDMV